jgi:hypothetical protein
MTVGVPEINLDTWGLRYVKKKQPHEVTEGEMGKIGYSKPISETAGQAPSNAESKISGSKTPSTKPTESTTAGNRASDADLDTPDAFRGRQEDSKGDKDVKVHNATDKPSTSSQVHSPTITEGDKEKPSGKYGVGSIVPAGSTQGDQKTPKLTTGKHGKQPDPKHPEKKDQQNPTRGVTERKNPEFASGKDTQADSTLLSTETRSQMRGTNPKTGEKHGKRLDRYGANTGDKKESRQPKGTGKPLQTQTSPEHKNPVPTGSGAPKIKAEMVLAIIKCKLLKMKTTEIGYKRVPDPERKQQPKEFRAENGSLTNTSGDGRREEVKSDVDDEKYSQGKNINYNSPHSEAGIQSGEIKPHPNPVKGEHTEDTKYFSQTGEELGRGKEGKKLMESDSKKKNSDEIVEKAIELINEAYGEMNKSNPVIVSDPKGKPFCSNCGRDHGKEDAKALEGTDDQQQRMVSGTRGGNKPSCPSCGHRPNKKAEDTEGEAGVNLKNVIEDLKETKKEGVDGGTSTTSSEGGFNHVYSDVHEAKRQKQNQ